MGVVVVVVSKKTNLCICDRKHRMFHLTFTTLLLCLVKFLMQNVQFMLPMTSSFLTPSLSNCISASVHHVKVHVRNALRQLQCRLAVQCAIPGSLFKTRSSAIAEGPRDALCQLKSCQLPRNSAETTYTTSPDQIDGMKLEI